MATADGVRRGRERQGAYQYIVHYSFLWILLRSLVVAVRFRPYGLAGLWFLWGYIKAAPTYAPRVEDPESGGRSPVPSNADESGRPCAAAIPSRP